MEGPVNMNEGAVPLPYRGAASAIPSESGISSAVICDQVNWAEVRSARYWMIPLRWSSGYVAE